MPVSGVGTLRMALNETATGNLLEQGCQDGDAEVVGRHACGDQRCLDDTDQFPGRRPGSTRRGRPTGRRVAMAEHHQLPEVHELLVFHPERVLLHEGPLQRLDDLDGFETSRDIGGSRRRLGDKRNGGRQRIQPIPSDGEGPAVRRQGPLRPRVGIGEEE